MRAAPHQSNSRGADQTLNDSPVAASFHLEEEWTAPSWHENPHAGVAEPETSQLTSVFDNPLAVADNPHAGDGQHLVAISAVLSRRSSIVSCHGANVDKVGAESCEDDEFAAQLMTDLQRLLQEVCHT
jgi:hypothetical protein